MDRLAGGQDQFGDISPAELEGCGQGPQDRLIERERAVDLRAAKAQRALSCESLAALHGLAHDQAVRGQRVAIAVAQPCRFEENAAAYPCAPELELSLALEPVLSAQRMAFLNCGNDPIMSKSRSGRWRRSAGEFADRSFAASLLCRILGIRCGRFS